MQSLCFGSSNYEFIVKMIDWNTLLHTEQTKEKVQKVTVADGNKSVRELFNETVVDILFYLSKSFRNKILQQVADEANKYYCELD